MPPKAPAGPSKKTEVKRQEKVIEDKTFGLKNKNKSKTVQNYVKSVASQVKKLDTKGGEAKRLADEFAEKQAKKKEEEKKALLNSLFKTVKKTQEIDDEPEEVEPEDDKYEEIDLYTDQREQIYSRRGEGANMEELDEWFANKDKTDKVCKFFLDSVEAGKYGWRWICPNGMKCMYKHALPQGYILRRDQAQEGKKEATILEEELERERSLLYGGTPVTLERFLKWKEDKRIKKEKEIEQKKVDESKKGKGTNTLSGRALFTYDPSLFQDDAEALGDEEYAEEENREDEEEKNDGGIDEEDEDQEEDEEEEEKTEETEKISLNRDEDKEGQPEEAKKKKKKNKKKDDDVKINEDVFLGEEDVELPEDDS
jgi:hypothetical protein